MGSSFLAVPWPATSQEALGDTAGVAGQPPPGQDSVQCRPRPSQQQNAGESQHWPCLVHTAISCISNVSSCCSGLTGTQSWQKGRINVSTHGAFLALLLVLGTTVQAPSPCLDKPVSACRKSLCPHVEKPHIPKERSLMIFTVPISVVTSCPHPYLSDAGRLH